MKHDHKKTKKLKVALFSMIMFLPFIAIGVTCATHIFNEEVAEQTQTAEIIYKYETETPQPNAQLKNNYIYKINETIAQNGNFATNYLKIVNDELTTIFEYNVQWDETNINDVWLDKQNSNMIVRNYNGNEFITIYTIENYQENYEFYTILVTYNQDVYNYEGSINTNFQNGFTYAPQNLIPIEEVNILTNPQDQTTNIFYDSCDQVQDSFILNWCTNGNPINSGVNAFTNAFNVPNGHIINTLITYWLCISMIYIVIDIIIECIVYITHFFNKEV